MDRMHSRHQCMCLGPNRDLLRYVDQECARRAKSNLNSAPNTNTNTATTASEPAGNEVVHWEDFCCSATCLAPLSCIHNHDSTQRYYQKLLEEDAWREQAGRSWTSEGELSRWKPKLESCRLAAEEERGRRAKCVEMRGRWVEQEVRRKLSGMS